MFKFLFFMFSVDFFRGEIGVWRIEEEIDFKKKLFFFILSFGFVDFSLGRGVFGVLRIYGWF